MNGVALTNTLKNKKDMSKKDIEENLLRKSKMVKTK